MRNQEEEGRCSVQMFLSPFVDHIWVLSLRSKMNVF